ncbi:MAG: hypothetical protein J5710_14105 [Treponema sp.]|nr:hypothetical protein [Treponema sp.]
MDNEVLVIGNICKSISGEEDENGNYIFEVEASNENLDLQNQRTLQSALMDSKEYFLTNGVISDDHQHKIKLPDGTVESHKEKIIGEPISVRREGKSTFVKGRLFAGIEAAKPYINLLKNKAKVVKASIGGIMPTIRKEKDGTETVTSFMWNDLALTTSPVNWTVGSARFAKSIGMVDFCKSLEAGSGTNAPDFESGRSLQKEDIEEETTKLLEINDGEMDPADSIEKTKKGKGKFFDKEELIKAAQEKEINDISECIQEIDKGNLNSADEIKAYLIGKGFEKSQAEETMLEIIEQGGRKMAKGNFSETVDGILKSNGVKKSTDEKKKPEDEEIEKEELFEFDDDSEGSDEEDDVEKCGAKGSVKKGCGVKKSLDEEEDYLDATELVKSMGEEIDALREENAELRKSIDETQNSVLEIAKALGEPVARQSVVAKSIPGNVIAAPTSNRKPTMADFDQFKISIAKSAQGGRMEPEEVQFLNSEFQKAMNGGIRAIKPETWQKICSIVRDNR